MFVHNFLRFCDYYWCCDCYYDYTEIGEAEKGQKIKVFSKAGAYLEIREPLNGWIKFKTEGRGWKEAMDYCIKCEQQDEISKTPKASKEDILKEISKGSGDFTLFITKNYIENLKGISSVVKDKDGKDKNKETENDKDKDKAGDNNDDDKNKDGDNENDGDKDKDKEEEEEKKTDEVELAEDAEYNIMDLINACNKNSESGNKMSIIYFMGDVDFGHTFETQQTHLNQLINLENKYGKQANFIIIRVCCVNNDITSDKVKEKLKIKNKELTQFIYGRSRMEILKIYGLLHYDTGFFKYGLMLLNKDNQIIIHPKENMDINIDDALNNDNNNKTIGIFEKVATYILSNQ